MIFLVIIIFAFILGLIIMVHEFGHFIMAKRANVLVQEFAFGFKPTLWKKKKGETTYAINAIPIGGYCAMLGEEEDVNHPRSFSNASIWNRVKIVVFGVVFNFLLAWILMTIWFWVLPAELPKNIVVVDVKKDYPAQEIGIKPNDFIISIDGHEFITIDELSNYNIEHRGETVEVKINRFNKDIIKEVKLSDDEISPLGISIAETGGKTSRVTWYLAPIEALKEIVAIIWINLLFIWKLITAVFTPAKAPVDSISGPVGIFSLLYQMTSFGWIYVLRFVSLLSVVIGFFNILPFPALDGGRLVFLGLEAIGGKKLIKSEIENFLHWLGFIILLILMVLITYQDIAKWIVK